MSIKALPNDQTDRVQGLMQRRLTLAAVIALTVHVAVILGVRIVQPFPTNPQPVFSLNVTLMEQAGAHASAAAGGVPLPIQPTPSTTELSETVEGQQAPTEVREDPALLITPESDHVIMTQQPQPSAAEPMVQQLQQPLPVRFEPLQALGADTQQLQPSRKTPHLSSSPREQTVEVIDTSTWEGFYAENWRLKVEQLGLRHFPDEVRRRKLVGRLTLQVSLRADGDVDSVTILQSSGHDILDQSAIHIVALGAPYDPFPESLRRRYDVLHIIRTWEFDQGNRLRAEQ